MKKTKIYFPLRRWTYPFRRFVSNIKRIYAYLPVIWRTYDFDYIYSLDMMMFQLERTVKYLESDNAHGESNKWRASRGRLIISLYKKYRNEYYATEPYDIFCEKYGACSMDLERNEKYNAYQLKGWKWEYAKDEEHNRELNKEFDELFKSAQKKQDKCNRLFWLVLQQYIVYIWD